MRNLQKKLHKIGKECDDLLLSKHTDYGRDHYAEFGLTAAVVHMDKQLRALKTWLRRGEFSHGDVEEKLRDIRNHATIGILVNKKLW
jgi:hypothetical protein